ncbi:hypothetical protein [Rhizobium sp. SAFR-030]|uniref:hypothetical protein n=1 Tax=Rhizobium sp. SAFR-030 TaxID=3387277 RepID=UPI003F7D5633
MSDIDRSSLSPRNCRNHLRLIALDGPEPADPPAQAQSLVPVARPAARRLLDEMLSGFAFAGESLHATPASMGAPDDAHEQITCDQPVERRGRFAGRIKALLLRMQPRSRLLK